MKKNFLRRMTRRKNPTPGEPEEGYEIPPPTAIEPGVPYSAEDTEGKDYDSHMELELLAADEPPGADSTNGADAQESDPAPALESLTEPVLDASIDTPETPSEAALYEEYGLDLEPLGEPEADESPEEAETSGQDDEGFSAAAESVGEAISADPEIPRDSEPEAVDESVQEVEEPAAAPDMVETRDTPVPQSEAALYEEYGLDLEPLNETEPEAAPEAMRESSLEDEVAASEALESVMEASASESEVQQEAEPEAPRNLQEKMQEQFDTSLAVQEVEESPVASVSEESTDEDEPLLEKEKPTPDAAESVVEAAASEAEIPEDSEPEPAVDITKEAGEPLAASVSPESPVESPEPSIAENELLSRVRNARGDWRPGKGFSRSELREAGLSPAEAARLHIRVDKRRRGMHPVNITALEEAKSGD